MNTKSNVMMLPLSEQQCEVSQTSMTYNAYDIYLDGDIQEPSFYRQAFQVLRSAQEGDLVRIYISSHGGNLNSALIFRNCILDCRAEVVGIIEAEAYSAGSLIALSCPSIEVKPYATMMCHSASFGSGGSVQNVRDHVEFTGKHAEDLMEEVYADFLTQEEFEDMRRGREIWLNYQEIGERLECMFEARQERMEVEMESQGVVQPHKPLEQLVKESVDAAMQNVLKQYDLVLKPAKPTRKAVKVKGDSSITVTADCIEVKADKISVDEAPIEV